MRQSRRRNVIRIMEGVALGLVLVDLVLWLGLVRLYDRKVRTEQERLEIARRRWQEEKARVAQLEKIQATGTDAELNDFLHDHMPPRRSSFSRAARLLSRLSQQSGVQLSGVNYRLNSPKEEPFKRLGMDISVHGPFPSLLSFAHGLETASDFVLVRSFSFEPGDGGVLALRLGAELYLTR